MSECVVRMEMPENCEVCPMCGTASRGNGMYELWCMCGDIPASSQRRPEDCPIVCQLPEGHGDLIDRDGYLKLLELYIETKRGVCENKEFIIALQAITKQIKCVKSIIPAERSEA